MRGEWCYFHKHFDPGTCQRILDLGLGIPGQSATLGVAGQGERKANDFRRSQIRFIEHDMPEFGFLFDELWRLGIRANREWFNFHVTNLSFVQLAEYQDTYQGEYKRHHDVFWMNSSPYHRKLTCVIQLTDPANYDGGDFELYTDERPDKAQIRDQGTVIFCPSFIEHAALPVTRGTRHSLAVWFEGPKWV